jgi:hypothetical protein
MTKQVEYHILGLRYANSTLIDHETALMKNCTIDYDSHLHATYEK